MSARASAFSDERTQRVLLELLYEWHRTSHQQVGVVASSFGKLRCETIQTTAGVQSRAFATAEFMMYIALLAVFLMTDM